MGILTKLQGYALTALAVIAVLFGAYAWGGRRAKQAAETKRKYEEAQRAAAGAKGVHDAQAEVNSLPTGGARDELRRDWMRNNGEGDGS